MPLLSFSRKEGHTGNVISNEFIVHCFSLCQVIFLVIVYRQDLERAGEMDDNRVAIVLSEHKVQRRL